MFKYQVQYLIRQITNVRWSCTVRKLSVPTLFITHIYRLLVVVCGSATIF